MSKSKRDKGVKQAAKGVISKGEKTLSAGLSALAKVEEEGRDLLSGDKTKMMKDLISEGRKVVRKGGRGAKIDRVRDAVSSSFDSARKQVSETYDDIVDSLDSGEDTDFQDRVAAALKRLNYPDSDDFAVLVRHIEALTEQIRKLQSPKRSDD